MWCDIRTSPWGCQVASQPDCEEGHIRPSWRGEPGDPTLASFSRFPPVHFKEARPRSPRSPLAHLECLSSSQARGHSLDRPVALCLVQHAPEGDPCVAAALAEGPPCGDCPPLPALVSRFGPGRPAPPNRGRQDADPPRRDPGAARKAPAARRPGVPTCPGQPTDPGGRAGYRGPSDRAPPLRVQALDARPFRSLADPGSDPRLL